MLILKYSRARNRADDDRGIFEVRSLIKNQESQTHG